MNLGIIAIVISILCLGGALFFSAPVAINVIGLVSGVVGLILLGRAKKGGGA